MKICRPEKKSAPNTLTFRDLRPGEVFIWADKGLNTSRTPSNLRVKCSYEGRVSVVSIRDGSYVPVGIRTDDRPVIRVRCKLTVED